jgi:outer membrane beta-barrel protein
MKKCKIGKGIFLLCFGFSLNAQEQKTIEQKPTEEKAAEKKVTEVVEPEATSSQETKKSGGASNLYEFLWLDQDKEVYVLQNKVYTKKHTHYFNLSYINSLEQKFQKVKGAQLKYGFYLTEEFAIEGFANIYGNSNNSEYDSVRTITGIAPFVRKINNMVGAMAVWSPFYGKINTFNKIFYFDWYFGAGLSHIGGESNIDSVTDRTVTQDIYKSESFIGVPVKTGFRAYINESYHVGLEYMNTSYLAPSAVNKSEKKWKTRGDLLLNFGFSF